MTRSGTVCPVRWGTVVGLLLTVAVTGGCVEGPEEGGTPPPLASGSPTPAPSLSPKPTASDVEQITALSKDYFAEANKALNTGDTRKLRSLSTTTCRCLASAEYVEKQWKTGSLRAPGYFRVSQVSGATVSSPIRATTNVVYTTGQEAQLDAAGRVVKTKPANATPTAVSLSLIKIEGVWKIDRIVKF